MNKLKQIIKILFVTSLSIYGASNSIAAPKSNVTVTSIVQHPNGVYFGITQNNVPTIVSAAQAKTILERACPTVHFAPGVLQ